MKVSYVAPINDGTGYANAAIRTILSLDAAGVDVVPLELRMANQNVPAPKRVQELSKKNGQESTHIIQNLLPYLLSYQDGYQNIGYFFYETDNFRPTGWHINGNLMDKIFVSCHANKLALMEADIDPDKIFTIPIGNDPSIYDREYKKIDFKQYKNAYKIYSIADFSYRKNILGIVESYFKAFSRADNVVLILKCYVDGQTTDNSFKIISEEILKIKQQLRKYSVDNYPKIILISQYLSDEEIMGLHQSCDLYVNAERGAAWCLPAFDAVGFNNAVIACGWGGPSEFIENGQNGFLLDYKMTPVKNMGQCNFGNLYTCHENWSEPDLEQLSDIMRYCYEKNWKPIPKARLDMLERFNLANSGNIIKSALEA